MNPKKSKVPPRGGKTESINLPGIGPVDPKDLSKMPEGNWVGMKLVGGKFTPGTFVAIDYSRGADNACVVLQPGEVKSYSVVMSLFGPWTFITLILFSRPNARGPRKDTPPLSRG